MERYQILRQKSSLAQMHRFVNFTHRLVYDLPRADFPVMEDVFHLTGMLLKVGPFLSHRSEVLDDMIRRVRLAIDAGKRAAPAARRDRSEEHTSELQSESNLVCRL